MRKDEVWGVGDTGLYIQTNNPLGYDVLINGFNKYLNFNMVSGVAGYGFRDNGGIMEFKNNGGVWAPITGGGGSGFVLTVTGDLPIFVDNTDPENPVISLTVVPLSLGGTGQNLTDPGFNAIQVWDNTTNAIRLAALSGITYDSGTNTLTVSPGTPGGSNTEVQYNNAGSFGGITGATSNGTTLTITAGRAVTDFSPSSNDGASLGTSSLMFSDLYLASGAVINFNNGNVGITHNNAGTYILVNPGDLRVTSANVGTNADSVPTLSSTSTLINKTLTSPVINVGSDATGDVYYRNAGGLFTRLGIGSTNDVLTVIAGIPSWQPTSGGGGMTWTEVTGTSQSAAVNNGYITNNVGLVTVTLPSTAAVGSVVRVTGKGAGGWRIAQNASQQIIWMEGGVDGTNETTIGTGGRIDSTDDYDSLELICLTADLIFGVLSVKGNPTLT